MFMKCLRFEPLAEPKARETTLLPQPALCLLRLEDARVNVCTCAPAKMCQLSTAEAQEYIHVLCEGVGANQGKNG